MAVSKLGHLGPSSGKIGPVVFYMLNGQQVSRSIGRPGKPSKAQLANRQGMAVTMKTLKPMLNFIKPGFELKAKGTTCNAFNLAVSYNKKHALKGEYPNLSIDYSKIMLSSGHLPSTEKTSIVKTEEGVSIHWKAENSDYRAHEDDLVMVLLHFPESEDTRTYLNAARRSDGTCVIPILDERMLNGPTEAYLCFKSADGERISDSIYIGNLNGSVVDKQEIIQKEKEEQEYAAVKARFEKVEAAYLKFQHDGTDKDKKAFRSISKEYQVLYSKLLQYSRKPG